MARMRIIANLDRCIGCNSCTAACTQENNLDVGNFYLKVHHMGPFGTFPDLEQYYLPAKCQHCDNPACVSVCPTGASYRRDEDGIVLVDHNKCIGCSYCVLACPYGVRSFNVKHNVIEKCTLCAQRVDKGESPACVNVCPAQARMFGDIDDPESDASKSLAENARHVHKLADVGNKPGESYVLSIAEWRE